MHLRNARARLPVHEFTPGGKLGEQWVELEDALRDIDAALGFRPYAVHIVWTSGSTGERVGVGAEQDRREFEMLPVPQVGDISGIVRQLTPRRSRKSARWC
jgi:hypothetical protein